MESSLLSCFLGLTVSVRFKNTSLHHFSEGLRVDGCHLKWTLGKLSIPPLLLNCLKQSLLLLSHPAIPPPLLTPCLFWQRTLNIRFGISINGEEMLLSSLDF